MSKREFIRELRTALSGRISPRAVEDNVSYYENYIDSRVRSGISEKEVMKELGDPRLIAKTITGVTDSGIQYEEAEEPREEETAQRSPRMFVFYAAPLIVLAVVLLVLWLVGSLLAFLAPIILPVMILVFIYSYFRKR